MNTNQTKENKVVKIGRNTWIASGQNLILGIQRAKQNLVARFQGDLGLPQRVVQVAVNEAESLAWETEFPQLVFPTLAEEKIAEVSAWYNGGEALRGAYALAV